MNTGPASQLLEASPPPARSGPSRRGCPSEAPCPQPRPWAVDARLAAPPTSPSLSKPEQWIQLRLQLGPAAFRRHLTRSKYLEMSPTRATVSLTMLLGSHFLHGTALPATELLP